MKKLIICFDIDNVICKSQLIYIQNQLRTKKY